MTIKNIKDLENKLIQTQFVKIQTEENSSVGVRASKFGGIPYWPHNVPYVEIKGKPAKMVAQINFEEVSKVLQIKDFPTTGILQFFCPYKDSMWGLTFNNEGSNTKVVYHKDVSDESYISHKIAQIGSDMQDMPTQEILSFNFNKESELLGFYDRYQSERQYDFSLDDLDDDLLDEIYEKYTNSGSKVGGFAYFTQEDPRANPKDEDWILLLQIDTDDNLMWGDCGVANWFIKRQDLINLDFSNVLFNWDCC